MRSLLKHIVYSEKFNLAHIQAYLQHRLEGPGIDSKYFIQPYLQVASDLQELKEDERVRQLAAWGTIHSLAEPTMILTRMLIEADEGKTIHPPGLGHPDLQLPGESSSYPDCPLLFFEGIPFFVVSGYTMFGKPQTPLSYLSHAIESGRWRSHSFHTVDEQQLNQVAARLITQFLPDTFDEQRLRRWVQSQIGPPSPNRNGQPYDP